MDEKLEACGAEAAGQCGQAEEEAAGQSGQAEEEAAGQTADGLFAAIRAAFPIIKGVDLRTYSPRTLAFIGDGIYDLVIRSLIVGQGNTSPNALQRRTSRLVRAQAQAEMVEALLPVLSEKERDWYRRGQNAKPATTAKNASTEDYHKATGFEALLGYLYLAGEEARLLDLIRRGLQAIGASEAGSL